MSKLAQMRKTVVAILGVAATVAATIPQGSPAWRYAQAVLALATAAGVWATPNRTAASVSPEPAEGSGTNPSTRMRSRVSQDRPPDVGKP